MDIFVKSGGIQSAIDRLSGVTGKIIDAESTLKSASPYLSLKKVSIEGVDGIISKISALKAGVILERLNLISDKAMFEAAEMENSDILPFGRVDPFSVIAGVTRPGPRGKKEKSFDMEAYKQGLNNKLKYYENPNKGYNIHKTDYSVKQDGNIKIYCDKDGNEVYREVFTGENGIETTETGALKTTRYDADGKIVFVEEYYRSTADEKNDYENKKDSDILSPCTKEDASVVNHINPNSNILLITFDGGSGDNRNNNYSHDKINSTIVNVEGLSDDVSYIYVSNTISGKHPAYGETKGDGAYYDRIEAVSNIAKESQKMVLDSGNFSAEDLYVGAYAYSYGGYGIKEFTEQFEKTNKIDDIYLVEAIASTRSAKDRVADGIKDLERYKELNINVTCVSGTDTLDISKGSAQTGKLGAEQGLCENIPNMGQGHSRVGENSANIITKKILEHAASKCD